MLNLLKNNDFYLLSKIWHEISNFFIVKRTTNCINKSGHILRIFLQMRRYERYKDSGVDWLGRYRAIGS